jgi:acyl-CoA synthetase (AMP-forming)/AMP-acid ligase II
MSLDSDARSLVANPWEFLGGSWQAMHMVSADRLGELQLAAIRMRFEELRDRIPALRATADRQGIDSIETLDSAVPLLFPHTTYKSYPAALLERNRFDALTRWLDRLTTRDLSDLDVSGCEGIDSWLDELDRSTDLRVAHSSATTGTMSFLPRTEGEWQRQVRLHRMGLFQFSDPCATRDHTDEFFEVIWPMFRRGGGAIVRSADAHVVAIAGGEEHFHAMYPGRMSSDLMFLAARLRAAEARGERDHLGVGDALRARAMEFEALQREMAEDLPRFLGDTVERLRGHRVYCLGTWNVLYNLAQAGLEQGRKEVFAPDSVIFTGGGAKGEVVPPDWKDVVKRFAGVEQLHHGYGMTELMAINKMCEHERFHLDPGAVLFVLDPDSGIPRPREGVQTGRAAFFDLLPDSYWGGFITGDEVSVDWSPCECGLTSAHLGPMIRRYSEIRGGDDKITCAATEEAHRDALEFLHERLS